MAGRYNHLDMAHLEQILKDCVAQGTRQRMIVTDGVFSMDGDIAPLRRGLEIESTSRPSEAFGKDFDGFRWISMAFEARSAIWRTDTRRRSLWMSAMPPDSWAWEPRSSLRGVAWAQDRRFTRIEENPGKIDEIEVK